MREKERSREGIQGRFKEKKEDERSQDEIKTTILEARDTTTQDVREITGEVIEEIGTIIETKIEREIGVTDRSGDRLHIMIDRQIKAMQVVIATEGTIMDALWRTLRNTSRRRISERKKETKDLATEDS